MTETDADVPDEHGITDDQRDIWRMYYVAITNMTQLAIMDAPTKLEAHRRIGILALELKSCAAAVDSCNWDEGADVVPPAAPATPEKGAERGQA